MLEIFESINQKMDELEFLIDGEAEDEDRLEELYFDLKEKVDEVLNRMPPTDNLVSKFGQLTKRLKIISERLGVDAFDAEGELDRMFPDRHDDDFDADSMSYESVFGDD